MPASENDPIAAPLQKVLSLFTDGPLAQVNFPDVDAASLIALTAAIREQAEKVSEAEQALNEARAALTEQQDALRTKAQRALAYARIYADGAPELRPLLDDIDLFSISPEPKAPMKRRGRPPKVRTAEPAPPAELTAAPSVEPPAAEEPALAEEAAAPNAE